MSTDPSLGLRDTLDRRPVVKGGLQTVEIHFNEAEFVSLLARHGIGVLGVDSISTDWRNGDAFAIKTYLCDKRVK